MGPGLFPRPPWRAPSAPGRLFRKRWRAPQRHPGEGRDPGHRAV